MGVGRQWEPVKEARGWPGLHPPLAAGPALALTRPAQGRVRTTLDCGQQTGAGLGAPGSPADSDPRLHGPGPALGIYEGSPNGPNASTGRDTARPGTRLLRAPMLRASAWAPGASPRPAQAPAGLEGLRPGRGALLQPRGLALPALHPGVGRLLPGQVAAVVVPAPT